MSGKNEKKREIGYLLVGTGLGAAMGIVGNWAVSAYYEVFTPSKSISAITCAVAVILFVILTLTILSTGMKLIKDT